MLYLIIYYAIPAVAYLAFFWWDTDLFMGSPSAYWQERRDLAHISKSIVAGALWPVAGFMVVRSIYLRWPVGNALLKDLKESEKKVAALRKALHLTVSDLELANEWSSQDNFRTAINEGIAALEATKEGA